MSGFPRPVFAGDFQSVKFYDLTPPNDRINIPSIGIQPLASLVTRNVVKGHLYEVVFGPIYVARTGVLAVNDFLRLIISQRELGEAQPSVIRTHRLEAQRPSEPYTHLTGYFVAPKTGTYRITVSGQRPNPELLGGVAVVIDNSILGIRGVASPETDFTIVNTQEV